MGSKVIFRLKKDEDGYPPISIEMVNATELSENRFQIDNALFFAENVSYHDVVEVTPTDVSGQWEFSSVVEQSSFTSLSIIVLDSIMDSALMSLFRGLDCILEYGEFGAYRMLAVAIPESVDYAKLRDQLVRFEDAERISFCELAVAH